MADNKFTSEISRNINGYLDTIMEARYGQDVRIAINNALKEMAKLLDDTLNSMYGAVSSAEGNIAQSASQYEIYATNAGTALTKLEDFETTLATITSRLKSIKEIETQKTDYTQNGDGGWVLNEANKRQLITQEVGNSVKWILRTPGVPQFREIHINYLQDPNSENFKDSINYDIEQGIVNVWIADPLAKLRVVGNVLDGSQVPKDTVLPTSLTWSNGVPTLHLSLPRGPDGSAGLQLTNRTFIPPANKLLYERPANEPLTSSYPFTEKMLVDSANHIDPYPGSTEKIGFSLSNSVVPKFDAVLVTFRKSVDNTSEFTISGVYDKDLSFPDNYDYDSTITVFIPRGGHAAAQMVDAKGRVLTRNVYWLDNNQTMHRSYSGGGKSTPPNTALLNGAQSGWWVAKSYTGPGLLFGNCYIDKVTKGSSQIAAGDGPEYSQSQDGSYKFNQDSGRWNPSTTRLRNQFCNLFLIPIKVTGIIYQMTDDQYGKFGISIST